MPESIVMILIGTGLVGIGTVARNIFSKENKDSIEK